MRWVPGGDKKESVLAITSLLCKVTNMRLLLLLAVFVSLSVGNPAPQRFSRPRPGGRPGAVVGRPGGNPGAVVGRPGGRPGAVVGRPGNRPAVVRPGGRPGAVVGRPGSRPAVV